MTTPLHYKGIESIDTTHKVLNIGAYNGYIVSCAYCGCEGIEPLGEHCLGFGSPNRRAGPLDKTLAVVYECPKCFERLWSHGTFGDYYYHLAYLHFKEQEV